MKRKRDKIHGQASKKLKATPSSDVFRLKVASKLSALLSTSLAELGEKTESLSASSELREVNRLPLLNGTVKPGPPSEQEDLDPLTRSLLNFIDSAKSRLSELFRKENEDVYAKKFEVHREDPLKCKNKKCSEVGTSVDQDSLQAQISEKFQTLFKKALSANILSPSVHEVEETETEVQIIDEEWQNVSLMLDDFLKSARKKVNDLLSTKDDTERNNKSIAAPPTTKSLPKKHLHIPNSKCSKFNKHLNCDSALDEAQGNSIVSKTDLSCSTLIPVLTHTPEKRLKSPKRVSVGSRSTVNCLLDKSSVINISSDNCVTNHDQKLVCDLTVKSPKAANLQCVKAQHISSDDKSVLESSSSKSNTVHSRTLRSCSLLKSTIKPKSTESSSTVLKNTFQHHLTRKSTANISSTSASLHQTKRKPSVVNSFDKDITSVEQSSSLKTPNTVAMEFGMPYEPNSFENSSNYELESLDYGTGSGILLMDEAEHAPDVLNLEVVIDERNTSDESSSEPEVLCLGEKVPTYEVVTIEEDEDVTHVPSAEVVPASSTESENLSEEKSFECPHCGKSYKVESLLKFHVRMHVSSVVQDQSTVEEDRTVSTSQEGSSQEKKKPPKTKKLATDKESSGAEVKLQKKKQARRHKSRHLS